MLYFHQGLLLFLFRFVLFLCNQYICIILLHKREQAITDMLPSMSGLAEQNVISYSYHSLMQASPFLFGDLGTRTFHSVAVNLKHPNTKVPAEGQKDTGKYCAMGQCLWAKSGSVLYHICLHSTSQNSIRWSPACCGKDLEGRISVCPKRQWFECILLSLTEHLCYQSILFYFHTQNILTPPWERAYQVPSGH